MVTWFPLIYSLSLYLGQAQKPKVQPQQGQAPKAHWMCADKINSFIDSFVKISLSNK